MLSKIMNLLRYYLQGYEVFDYYFAQGAEDNILSKFFPYNNKGFYIDIGAYHPYIYSNTFYFYKRGWNGINVDANPECISQFHKRRKRDINLALGIGLQEGMMDYYILGDQNSMNTFSYEKLKELNMTDQIIKKQEIQIWTLEKMLDTYLPPNQSIDFISIDVEGYDFQVLQSNNWEKYLPKILVVEMNGMTLKDMLENEITLFLEEKGYQACAKNMLSYHPDYPPANTSSVFFVHRDFRII